MTKIYLSSTYEDLKEHRETVCRILRKLNHVVVSMEDYVAGDQRPADKCLADVAACDVYLGLFAWRYGYVPDKDNPDQLSITELEYRKAVETHKPLLIFLTDPKSDWPVLRMDAHTGDNNRGERIATLRSELQRERIVSTFRSPHELASLVAAAVAAWEKSLQPGAVATSRTSIPPDSPSPVPRPVPKPSWPWKWIVLACLMIATLVLAGWLLWRPKCTLERANALLEQRHLEEAITCYDEIIVRDPARSIKAFAGRAEAYNLKGKRNHKQALAQYDKGLDAEKELRFRDAVEDYKQAYQLDESLFWAANNLAVLLAQCPDKQLRNLSEASRYAEEACRRSGWKCWQVLDTLAVVRAVQGNFAEAVSLLQKALALAPEDEKPRLLDRLHHYQQQKP